jgi:hypothetical protein
MLKLSHHHHSGRVLPHHHTSYAGLTLVMLVMGLFMLGISVGASANNLTPPTPAVNPQNGALGFVGVVPGPPPSIAPTILAPRDGLVFSSVPITISGTCQTGLLVSITSQDVFVGSTTCDTHGAYSLLIDLFAGVNRLAARHVDALGQTSPASNAVTVNYHPPSFSSSGNITPQLFLQTDAAVEGGSPGQSISWKASIVGGTAPYAVSFDWGDGKSDLVSRSQPGPVSANHAYSQPGTYLVLIRVTDANNNAAFIQVVTVVNGAVAATGTGTSGGALRAGVLLAWPIYVLAGLLILTFWLGERREIFKFEHQFGSAPQA